MKILAINLNRVKLTIIVILMMVMSWQLASLVELFLPYEQVTKNSSGTDSAVMATKNSIKLDAGQIIALNLFGEPERLGKVENQQEQQIKAPETSLNLKLRGLRKGQGTIKSSAIIEDERKSQDIYYLGDKISGQSNVTIHEIYSQRLILQRAGKFETLTLFDVLQKTENSKDNNSR